MAGINPFLIFLDTVSSAEAFVRDADEYGDTSFRMEIIKSYQTRILMVYDCISRLPNITVAQMDRVFKVLNALNNLKDGNRIAVHSGPTANSTAMNLNDFRQNTLNDLRRKGIHNTFSEDK